jgi:genome maintenance exonuclease 1
MFIQYESPHIEDLETETIDGKRFYCTPDGQKLPSVTTVLGAKGKKEIYEWRKRVGNEEANRVSRIATGRGNKFHTMCENYVKNKPIVNPMPDAEILFKQIRPIIKENLTEVWYQEQALWSTRYLKMAGRVDLIGKWNDRLSVIDFKTSKRQKKKEDIDDYFCQCTAYAIMMFERTGIMPDDIVIVMATDSGTPLVFVERPKNYLNKLLESIEYYRLTNKKRCDTIPQ